MGITRDERLMRGVEINIQLGLNDRMCEAGYISPKVHDLARRKLLQRLSVYGIISIDSP